MNRLTKRELSQYESRVDEINDLIDQCGDNDRDVLDNLDIELAQIIDILERSLNQTIKEEFRGLTVIIGGGESTPRVFGHLTLIIGGLK